MSRDRTEPRMSITKMGEYLIAPAGRRRTILRDQKFPAPFKAARFREAHRAIREVMLAGGDPRDVDRAIDDLRRRRPSSPFEAECLSNCIEALVAFKKVLADGALAGLPVAPGIDEAYVEMRGVDLSVRPELLIGGDEPGAIKFYIAKSTPLTVDDGRRWGSAGYAAAMLHQWAEQEFGVVETERCLVVDVFAGQVSEAPARYARRREDIAAACEEIAIVWSSIMDPRGPGASGPSPF